MVTIKDCINRIQKLKKGDQFILKELFTKEEWENATPTVLGKKFKEEVKNRKDIKHVMKKDNNHNKYEKL